MVRVPSFVNGHGNRTAGVLKNNICPLGASTPKRPQAMIWEEAINFSITCFPRHYDILAKTRSRMTTALAISRRNDAG